MKHITILAALLLFPACTNPKDKLTTIDLVEEILSGKRTSSELSENEKKRLRYEYFGANQRYETHTILNDAINEKNLQKLEADPELGPYAKALRPTLSFKYYQFQTTPKTSYYLPCIPLSTSDLTNLRTIWEEFLKNPNNENITIEIKGATVELTLVKTVEMLGRQIQDTTLTVYCDREQIKNLPHYNDTFKSKETK